jgi:hypothetical protein
MAEKPNKRIIQKSDRGGWDVVKPGAQRASAHADTQKQAMDRGREILKKAGGGELVIKDTQGRIRDSDTVPHSNDPNPPKDTK